ncbi:restriction endonuclease [Sesbania bispinosa]|nr:restriction endonuclease [Sesbania bispinosa]
MSSYGKGLGGGRERSGSYHELPRVDDLWFGAEGFVFRLERGKCEMRGGVEWWKGCEVDQG